MEKAKVTEGEKIDLILKTMSEGLKRHEEAQKAAKGRDTVQTHQAELVKAWEPQNVLQLLIKSYWEKENA
jgi:hypothetical protein